MSTKVTELAAKITADATQLKSEIDRVATKTKEIGKASQSASAQSVQAFDKLGTKVENVAKGVGAVSSAFYAMNAQGSAQVLALGNTVGQVAGLFGPQGRIVGAVATAASAIVALFLQAKEKSAEATKSIEDNVRSLINAGDLAAVDKRLSTLFNGTISGGGKDGKKAIEERIALLEEEQRAINTNVRVFKTYAEQQPARNANTRDLTKERAALKQVNDEYAALLKGREALVNFQTGQAGRRAVNPVDVKADSPEKTRRETEKAIEDQKRAVDALQQRLASLGVASDPVASLRLELQKLFDAAAKAGVPVPQLAKLQTAIDDALGTAQQQRAKDMAQKLRELVAQTTISQVDDLEVSLTQLQDRLVELGANPEALKELTAIRQRVIDARRETESWNARLAELKKTSSATGSTTSERASLTKQLSNDELRASQLINASADERAQIDERIKGTKERIAELNAEDERRSVNSVEQSRSLLENVALVAGGLQGAASAAFGLATAFLGTDAALTKVLGSVAAVSNGVGDIARAAEKAGGLGELFSTGKGIASAAGPIGAIVGGIGAIVTVLGQTGEAAKRERERLQKLADEFNASLASFGRDVAAQGLTDIERAQRTLSEKIGELVRQATTSAGFADPGAGGTSSSSAARAYQAELRQQAAAVAAEIQRGKVTGKRFLELAASFGRLNGLADALDGVIVEAEKAEAAFKAEREAKLATRVQDLALRRLALDGDREAIDVAKLKLEQIRELQAAEEETRGLEGSLEYLRELQAIQRAELAAAEATARRVAALNQLDSDNDILGGSAIEQLQRTIATLSNLFPQFASLFDGIDTSTRDGLQAARAKLQELYRSITADGVITDAEQIIIDAIKRAMGGIDSALSGLGDSLEQSLNALAERVSIFGLSASEQLTALIDIFRNSDLADVQTLLKGVDTESPQGLAAFKKKLQDAISNILSDGIVSAEEQPILDALKQLLGGVAGVLDDLAKRIADGAAKLEADRQQRVGNAGRTLDANLSLSGASGADALQQRIESLSGLSPALAALLPLFSDTSASGIAKTKDALFQLFRDIESGKVSVSDLGDLTKDELIDAIIKLNDELGDLESAAAAAAVATAAATEAERQATADLKIRALAASGGDTRLQAFDLAAKRERDKAVEDGKSTAFLNLLDQVQSAERSALISKLNQESLDAIARSANASAASGAADASAGSRSTVVSDIGSLTQAGAQTLAGLLREIAINTGPEGALYSVLSARIGPPVSLNALAFPSFPGGSGGARTVTIGSLTVHVTVASDGTQTPSEIGGDVARGFERELSRILSRAMSGESAFLGSARR